MSDIRSKNDNYIRPKYTLQDKITDEEIKIMLEDYIEVDDITKVNKGTHIRYYTVLVENDRAKKVFRIGGNLKFVSTDNVYIILANGDSKWSVQIKNSIFYRQLSIYEIKDEYEQVLDEYESEILELKKINRKLYKKLTGHTMEMSSNVSTNMTTNSKEIHTLPDKRPMRSARKSNKIPPSKNELMKYDTEKNIRL